MVGVDFPGFAKIKVHYNCRKFEIYSTILGIFNKNNITLSILGKFFAIEKRLSVQFVLWRFMDWAYF